jgi:hypothetical protein
LREVADESHRSLWEVADESRAALREVADESHWHCGRCAYEMDRWNLLEITLLCIPVNSINYTKACITMEYDKISKLPMHHGCSEPVRPKTVLQNARTPRGGQASSREVERLAP